MFIMEANGKNHHLTKKSLTARTKNYIMKLYIIVFKSYTSIRHICLCQCMCINDCVEGGLISCVCACVCW